MNNLMVLHRVDRGTILLDPFDVMKVEETDYGTGIVTEDYSLYEVQESPEEIKEMITSSTSEQEEEKQE